MNDPIIVANATAQPESAANVNLHACVNVGGEDLRSLDAASLKAGIFALLDEMAFNNALSFALLAEVDVLP